MNTIPFTPLNDIAKAESFWASHPFYSSATVLGIDVGLEGIGIYLRKGAECVYAKTWIFDLPQPDRLAQRRQFRAARHCRKNRKRRLRRLRRLLEAHGLPWVSDDVLSRSDPFLLRHRAVEKTLASKEALSICIRHLVTHRGYDYYANIEGDFPWGSDTSVSKALDWVRNSFIDDTIAALLEEVAPELTGSKIEERRSEFLALIDEKRRDSRNDSIRDLLSEYARCKKPNFRAKARGHNFPRAQVESHLREIIARHHQLIERTDEFISALFFKPSPDRPADKSRAIFHYNRKTQDEIARLWEKKMKDCPFTGLLDLPSAKVGSNAEPAIRQWSLLQFLATRSFEIQRKIKEPTGPRVEVSAHRPSPSAVQAVLELASAPQPAWTEIKRKLIADAATQHPGAKDIPGTQSPLNKDYFTHLRDLSCPSAANLKKRASLCAASAEALYNLATANDTDFDPAAIIARLNGIGFFSFRRTPGAGGPVYPQVAFLLGQRKKRGRDKGKLAVPGKLHRLFDDLADQLDSASAPDYCVIEVIGTLPRNTEQRREIETRQKERRALREKLFTQYARDDSGKSISRRRIDLFEQQRGRCPYTGRPLGEPHADDLNIDHIFPQSRGGLSVDQNLVLTFQSVNLAKDNRTPREAAEAGLPGFLSWPAMLKNTQDMKWGQSRLPGDYGGDRKSDVFAFQPSPGRPVPDLGNTTRTAQLARQLIEGVADWMGIASDADERALRIGTPSGWLTAQARKTWMPEDKDRARLIHHLVDAAVLAHIPPREGMNHVRYRGIFYPDVVSVVDPDTGMTKTRPVTRALAPLGPPLAALAPLLATQPEICPVERHRPRKRTQSLGDSTFWRLDTATGSTYQKVPLDPQRFTTIEDVVDALNALRIPPDLIPTRAHIDRWLDAASDNRSALTLRNGTPVTRGAKKNGKGSMKSPGGWSGRYTDADTIMHLRALTTVFDRMEIWLGWNGKAWSYFRKPVMDRVADRHLRKLVADFDGTPAPAWMQKHPTRPETHKTVSEIICGKAVPAGSRRVGALKRGDQVRIGLDATGAIVSPTHQPVVFSWYMVSAIKTSGEIEFTNLLTKRRDTAPFTIFSSDKCLKPRTSEPDKLAQIVGLPGADTMAASLRLSAPTTGNSRHDPPSDPPRRLPGTSRESGQVDFRFEENRD